MIMSSEVSSNLARYDGVRYGLRVVPEDGPVTIERVMSATRSAGFGHEVKRRIILGTYALSAGNFDAYYGAALRVRTLIQRDYAAAFEKCDVLISQPRPPPRSSSARRPKATPWQCTWATSQPCPSTWQASRRSPARRPLRREQPARRHPVHCTRTRRRTPLPRRRSTGRTAHRKMGRTALQEPARHRNSDPRL